MAGTNHRNKSFSRGDYARDFNGRSDYSSGRPKKAVDSMPDMGDKGIPPQISTSKEYVEKKGTQFPQEAGDKGIPPMNANPKSGAPRVSGGGYAD